jgi:chloride channel protein, CIC family
MKVLDIMNRNVITCYPHEKLPVVMNKLELFHITGMPVVEKGFLVGIISLTDILRAVQTGSVQDVLVEDVMTKDVVTVLATDSAIGVAKIMVDRGINRLPVVENRKVVGIVTRGDMIKAVAICE